MATTAQPLPPGQEESFSLADKRVEIATYDRWKGRKDQTDRLAILSRSLIRVYAHYIETAKQKMLFRCITTSPTDPKICCVKTGDPRQQFGVVLFHYLTDPSDIGGDLIDPNSLKGRVKLWIISDTRYNELSVHHKSWPLLDDPEAFTTKQHDLIVRCTEEKYQKLTIQISQTAHWKQKPEWYKALKLKENSAKQKLKLAMGRTLTEKEIEDLLGVSASIPNPTGSTVNSGDVDLSDVLG